MSAHANFVALHVTLAPSAMKSTPKGDVGWSGLSHFEIDGDKRISQHLSALEPVIASRYRGDHAQVARGPIIS